MHVGFALYLFVIHIFSFTRSDHDIPACTSTTQDEPSGFFENEPIPLSSSLVDDLTTLASTVYITSVITVVFILLAWITHYNAPCSSLITSILSTITGLPEPIIHSVALCGSCCMWCEKTWMFRRIHQFNIWMSNKVTQFLSGTCKVLCDTICPCCRPPDTPSNRSIIGSLPASIVAMIHVSDITMLSPPRPTVTTSEPIAISSGSLTIHVGSADPLAANLTPLETNISLQKIDENQAPHRKHKHRRPRRKPQSKQGSAFEQSPYAFSNADNDRSSRLPESDHELSID